MGQLSKGASLEDVKALVDHSEVPVLIDCYTPTCAPCAALAPILGELSAQMEGALAVEKIDVGASPAVARALGVRGVPTLLLYKDGILKASRTGGINKPQLHAWLAAQGVNHETR